MAIIWFINGGVSNATLLILTDTPLHTLQSLLLLRLAPFNLYSPYRISFFLPKLTSFLREYMLNFLLLRLINLRNNRVLVHIWVSYIGPFGFWREGFYYVALTHVEGILIYKDQVLLLVNQYVAFVPIIDILSKKNGRLLRQNIALIVWIFSLFRNYR